MAIGPNSRDVGHDFSALVGRALMSALFISSGYAKLVGAAKFKVILTSLGVPFPDLAWAVAVAVELGGGLALLFGAQARAAAATLAVWCIATAFIGHRDFTDLNSRIHFMKNIAMTGGLLFIVMYGAGAYSVENIRLRLRSGYIGRLSHW